MSVPYQFIDCRGDHWQSDGNNKLAKVDFDHPPFVPFSTIYTVIFSFADNISKQIVLTQDGELYNLTDRSIIPLPYIITTIRSDARSLGFVVLSDDGILMGIDAEFRYVEISRGIKHLMMYYQDSAVCINDEDMLVQHQFVRQYPDPEHERWSKAIAKMKRNQVVACNQILRDLGDDISEDEEIDYHEDDELISMMMADEDFEVPEDEEVRCKMDRIAIKAGEKLPSYDDDEGESISIDEGEYAEPEVKNPIIIKDVKLIVDNIVVTPTSISSIHLQGTRHEYRVDIPHTIVGITSLRDLDIESRDIYLTFIALDSEGNLYSVNDRWPTPGLKGLEKCNNPWLIKANSYNRWTKLIGHGTLHRGGFLGDYEYALLVNDIGESYLINSKLFTCGTNIPNELFVDRPCNVKNPRSA